MFASDPTVSSCRRAMLVLVLGWLVLAPGGVLAGDLDCSRALPLTCGSISGTSPASLGSAAEDYSCDPDSQLGNEVVYELFLPAYSVVDLTVDAGPRTMNVFVLSSCEEADCYQGGAPSVTVDALPPGIHYIVVEPETAADEGSFDLDVDCTTLSSPIACETNANGSTFGGISRFDAYDCVGGDLTGAETWFHVDVPPASNLQATVTGPGATTVVIFSADGPIEAGTCLSGGAGAATLFGAAPGTYLIGVDGPAGDEGAVQLQLSCASELGCGAADPIVCGVTVTGNTASGTDVIDMYPSCSGSDFSGNELVYRFDNPVHQPLTFTLDDSAETDLELFLLDACNEGACIEVDDNQFTRLLTAGTYYLVVDGRNGAEGVFDLDITCFHTITPEVLEINLSAGECFNESKSVALVPEIPRADVLIAIDLTVSMTEERDNLQDNINEIVDRLREVVTDLSMGLISYRDYDSTGVETDPCFYDASLFGEDGDWPYRLEQPLTTSRIEMSNAVANLPNAFGGGDGPESTSRVMFETYSDPAIEWRPEARRMLVHFGDILPHDCNWLECFGEVSTPTSGYDLGRDEIPGTADDLSIMEVVNGMRDNQITMVHFHSGDNFMIGGHTFLEMWECWTGLTYGSALLLDPDGTPPDGVDLVDYIETAIRERVTTCAVLELTAEEGFEDWLVDAGAVYNDQALPATLGFDIQICAPIDTEPGIYTFEVQVQCTGGFLIAQQVTVTVVGDCSADVVADPPDVTTCRLRPALLDARGLRLAGCVGETLYEWTETASGARVGEGAIVEVLPLDDTDYTVTVSCDVDPGCRLEDTLRVTVERPPNNGTGMATDLSDCGTGIRLDWTDATFRDPSGTGTYNIYRDDFNCARSLLRTPLAVGLTELTYTDLTTVAGTTYYYAVEAEDARTDTACMPTGPNNGGAVARLCLAAVTDELFEPPELTTAVAVDVSDCALGVDLSWDPAIFNDASASGVYNIYRSEVDCADALTRPPVVLGLTETTWSDPDTVEGTTYHYVVEAEDGRTGGDCDPSGPNNGGAVVRLCVEAVVDELFPPPTLDAGTAGDADPCSTGVDLSWDAATFPFSGTGVYNIYRSEVSCEEALMRGPLVTGLTDTNWSDTSTVDGLTYHYVVEAEDERMSTGCETAGGDHGGAAVRLCLDPVTEAASVPFPDGVYATLRAANVGEEVTMLWADARALDAGEAYHLLKTSEHPTMPWVQVNPAGDTARSFTETDTRSTRQFFDLRIESLCGDLSIDEYPPTLP
ncbi:MAG: hypothetical protein AAF533_17410 [Acidobacteriota bacterium]